MNPEVIYTNFRDHALAEMFAADYYQTFVAMPLGDRFSYHPRAILNDVIIKSANKADAEKSTGLKKFVSPQSAIDIPGTANVITEDIVKQILYSHFFLADLTGQNAGVLLETGIAMAFKPSTQIILICQDPLEELHFDIRNNRVISYNPDGQIDEIKKAFLFAGTQFEQSRKKYVTQVVNNLTIDAIRTIHFYGALYQTPQQAKGQPGLFTGTNMPPHFKEDFKEQAAVMFQLTLHELFNKKLIWMDYGSSTQESGDYHTWAAHASRLGWLVIQNQWPHMKSDLCERIR